MAYEYSGIWKWLYDWQTLATGILALVGAGLAVCAANAQTRAVKEQNAELKRQSRRDLAHQGIVAIWLLLGVLARIVDSIESLQKVLDQPLYHKPDSHMPIQYREMICRTDLSVVWDTLGKCGREIVAMYLVLDMELARFASSPEGGCGRVRDQLQSIRSIVKSLQDELESEAKICNKILSTESED